MDAFINSFSALCDTIIPILVATVLICLIIVLIKVIKVLENVDDSLAKMPGTIDLVDKSIEKVQAPLDTVVKVSGSVDKAHDATVEAVKNAKDFVEKNSNQIIEKATDIKDKVVSFINKDKDDTDYYKEPSPEDIIGD